MTVYQPPIGTINCCYCVRIVPYRFSNKQGRRVRGDNCRLIRHYFSPSSLKNNINLLILVLPPVIVLYKSCFPRTLNCGSGMMSSPSGEPTSLCDYFTLSLCLTVSKLRISGRNEDNKIQNVVQMKTKLTKEMFKR